MAKKLFSIALALMLVIGCFSGVIASADGEDAPTATEYDAALGLTNTDWSGTGFGAESTVQTKINGAGTYSLVYSGKSEAVKVLVVDILGAAADFEAAGLKLTALSVLADGVELPIDLSKVLTGDLEGKGNFRIDIHNIWGDSAKNPNFEVTGSENEAAIVYNESLEVKFTLGTEEAGASYDAVLGYADPNWSQQNWELSTKVTGAGNYSLTWNPGAEVNGALVFVVDIKGAAADFAAAGLKLTELSVLIDGKELPVDMSKVLSGDLEEKGNFRIEIYNEYGATKGNAPITAADVVFSESLTVNFTLAKVESSTSYDAALGLVASDWSASTGFGVESNTKIQVGESGTYTINYTGACKDLGILVVDVIGAQAAMDAANKTWQVSDVVLTVDGNAVAVDASKLLSGDLEENGNFRLEVYNMYGNSKNDPAIDHTTAVNESLSLTFTLTVVDKAPTGGEDTKPEPEKPVFNPDATYNAYLLLQTPNWTYRNAWNDKTNGIDAETWGNALYGNETKQWYGEITDAVLAGNGTYTIEITNFGTIFEDDFAAAGQDFFNIIGFTSDAPLGGLTITDVKLIIDGSTKHKVAQGYQNPDDEEYVNILIQNIWNPDVKEISYYPAPTTSLKIEFTVSGFSYDKAATGGDVTPGGDDVKPGGDDVKPGDNQTKPATGDEDKIDEKGGSSTGIVIAIVAVVVVAAALVVVFVFGKKKA